MYLNKYLVPHRTWYEFKEKVKEKKEDVEKVLNRLIEEYINEAHKPIPASKSRS